MATASHRLACRARGGWQVRRPRGHRRRAPRRRSRRDLRQGVADRRPHARRRSHAGREADIDAAVKSARAAFDDGRWCGKPPAARKKILQRFADKILAAKDELALLETLDMGKPIQYSLSVDVPSTARTHRLVRRGHRQGLRRDRADAGLVAGADHARADGRGRRRRALELPDDHGRVEARPGAGHRQLGGVEAEREVALHRVAPGRTGRRGRPAAGRLQRRARLRPRGRRSAGAAHGRRRDRLHRQHARGPQDARIRRAQQPEARLQRTRRQVGLRRVRRFRRCRTRRQDRRRQHVLQPGRELQCAVARAGAREHRRPLRRDRRRRSAGTTSRPIRWRPPP